MDASEPLPEREAVAKFLTTAFPRGFHSMKAPSWVNYVNGKSFSGVGELWIGCGRMINSIAGAMADRVTGKLGADVRAVATNKESIFALVKVSETHYIIIENKG